MAVQSTNMASLVSRHVASMEPEKAVKYLLSFIRKRFPDQDHAIITEVRAFGFGPLPSQILLALLHSPSHFLPYKKLYESCRRKDKPNQITKTDPTVMLRHHVRFINLTCKELRWPVEVEAFKTSGYQLVIGQGFRFPWESDEDVALRS